MNRLRNPYPLSLLAAALAATVPAALSQERLVLEEIVVTAQKREATVQEISATVNVVTGAAIEEFASFGFTEIEQQTAGLTLAAPNARNSNISMRGISTDPEAGLPSAVDVYWNDSPVRFDVAFNALYDLERLEILRGPQGTLQGRTSPAGAINILTRGAMLDDAGGYLQASASDNDGFNGQFAYGAPLIEGKLGFRIAGVYDTNNAENVENINTGLDDPESETGSARLSLAWAPTDTFDASLVWQYLDRDTDDPRAVTGSDSLGERPDLDSDDRTALGPTNNYGNLDYNVATLTFNWDVAGHTVTAVSGYTDSDKESQTENDRAGYISNPETPTFQQSDTEVDSFSQEIRIASQDNDFWDYMVGVFYQDQDTDTTFTANTTLTPPNPEISFYTFGVIPVDSETTGVFTFNTLYLNDRTELEIGLRWSKFERSRRADVFFGDINYLPPGLRPIEELVKAGLAANFPINAVSDENEDSDDDTVTGNLSLRYDWSDDVSVYAAYNRGYRPGGISIMPDPDVQYLPNGEDDLLHDEEDSDSIELGFKSRLLDDRAQLNGAIYYQQFDGYLGFARGIQVLDDSGEPVDLAGGLIYNGDANVWGAELEGKLLLSDNWNLGGAVSYAKGEWDGAEAPCNEREPGEVLGSCDIDGEAIGGEPEWSLSLNSEFFQPIGAMEWYLRGLYKYTGERDNIDASAGIDPVTDEFEEHHVFNLYAGLRSSDNRWDVSLWAKNLFDSDEVTFQTSSDQYDLALSGGSYTQTNIQRERVIGATARYNF